MTNEKRQSLTVLSDGAKVLNGLLIPDRKNLRRWMKRNHPEYLREFDREE
jgi:hypothetical protein